jgi:WD40 repeat protein
VNSVAFSQDGKRIVMGCSDKSLRIWDAETGRALSRPMTGHEGGVYSVAFSHDGKRIVSGSDDGTIRVWDAETGGDISSPISGHVQSCNSVPAFSIAPMCIFQQKEMAFSPSLEHSFRARSSITTGPHFSEAIFHIQDGWILGRQGELLFWVPPEHRLGLWWPRTLTIIGTPYTRLDLSQFNHGQTWTACYC